MRSSKRRLISLDFFYLGVLSWILVIPFDVIKTIMQAEIDPTKHRQMGVLFRTKTHVRHLPNQTSRLIFNRNFYLLK